MTGRGRPLRFLGAVAIAWVGVRAALLWPQVHSLPDAIRLVVPLAPAPPSPRPPVREAPRPIVMRAAPPAWHAAISAPPPRRGSDPMRVQLALLNMLQFGAPEPIEPFATVRPAAQHPAGPQSRGQSGPSRWSQSAWLVARPGMGLGAAPRASQLGGGQLGARLAYALFPEQRIALYGRFAAPLKGKGREAALGVEWQPTRLPARLIAEQRFGIDGQRGGPSMGLVAGGSVGLPAGFSLESYGQAGAVARERIEPFADGAARATHPIAGGRPVRLDLGVGAWGAVQREAGRLDVGPSAVAVVALAGKQIRLALDWRQRVAGDARPGSGIAFTIGSDF